MRIEASQRKFSSLIIKLLFLAISSGPGGCFNPSSFIDKKTQGLAISASVAVTLALPTPRVSLRLPVGNKCPVRLPAGYKKSSHTGDPVPATPSIKTVPLTPGAPPSIINLVRMSFPVFVSWMTRETFPSSITETRERWTAKGPTAEDIFPQAPAYSTRALLTDTCAKV